jgi:hypothetical protein
VSSDTCASVAPFCGANTFAASRNGVVTSQATVTGTAPNDHPRASMAARPPSVVALPPTPTITRRAPARMAAAISSPVPRVDARSGSRTRGASARPLARAISTTATPPGSNAHSASTGSPSGPVTVTFRREPPRAATSASSVPSPPSASGSDAISSKPARRNPSLIAPAASAASRVPLNLSGHTRAESISR